MTLARCRHCDHDRIVINAGTPHARYRRHGRKDTKGHVIVCEGSLQPVPHRTTLREV